MSPIQNSVKSMGTAAPVLFALALLTWTAMLISIFGWIGRTPAPGRETDRVVAQAYSGGTLVLLWIFLTALVLVGSSKQVVPGVVGALAWIVLPVSGLGALAAIGVLYEPHRHWPVLLPVLFPPLIAGYVAYTFFPAQTVSVTTAGLTVWGIVCALSVAVAPVAAAVVQAYGGRGYVRDVPGPELDAFKASEANRFRQEGLDALRQMDDETKLYEIESWMRPTSPVREQAIEFARHLPNRQIELIRMLNSSDFRALWMLDLLDVEPTPELCQAGRACLRSAVRQRQQMFHDGPNQFVGIEFSEGVSGIAWISQHCGCKSELDLIEAYARDQDINAPEVKKFLDALAEIKEKTKEK